MKQALAPQPDGKVRKYKTVTLFHKLNWGGPLNSKVNDKKALE